MAYPNGLTIGDSGAVYAGTLQIGTAIGITSDKISVAPWVPTTTISDVSCCSHAKSKKEITKEQLEKDIDDGVYEEVDKDYIFAYMVADKNSTFHIGCERKLLAVGKTYCITNGRIMAQSYDAAKSSVKKPGGLNMTVPKAVKELYRDLESKVFKVKIAKENIEYQWCGAIDCTEVEIVEEMRLFANISFKVVGVYRDSMKDKISVQTIITNDLTGAAVSLNIPMNDLAFTAEDLTSAIEDAIEENLKMCDILDMTGEL